VFDRHLDRAAMGMRSETPHPSIAHERVVPDEFEEMRFDVGAHDTVGFDDGAGLRIDVVPRTPELRVQPASQRAEHISEPFAASVRTANALMFGKVIEVPPGSRELACPGLSAERVFDDNFVHVWSHSAWSVDVDVDGER